MTHFGPRKAPVTVLTPEERRSPAQMETVRELGRVLEEWFGAHGRDLPMRDPSVGAWASLVFEVMSHQTPIPRVQPVWQRWMRRWPTPEDLAAARASEVLVNWDRLGYPSRALRLRECAQEICRIHEGEVPTSMEELLALPGVGPYTASALASFHFHQRVPVLDTNVRRVLARILAGRASAANGAPTRAEVAHATAILPEDGQAAAEWNLHLMEFGALACTQRSPSCGECPVADLCQWRRAGYPPAPVRRRAQAWAGTDRQARGRVMALLRESHGDVPGSDSSAEVDASVEWAAALEAATLPGAEAAQALRVLTGLEVDGLIRVEQTPTGRRVHLP